MVWYENEKVYWDFVPVKINIYAMQHQLTPYPEV